MKLTRSWVFLALLLVACAGEPGPATPAAQPVAIATVVRPTTVQAATAAKPAPAPAPTAGPTTSPPVASPTRILPMESPAPPICETDLEGAFWAAIALRKKFSDSHGGNLNGLGNLQIRVCNNRVIPLKIIAPWIEEKEKKNDLSLLPFGKDPAGCCADVARELMWAIARWQEARRGMGSNPLVEWLPIPTEFWSDHAEDIRSACGVWHITIQMCLDILFEPECRKLGYQVTLMDEQTVVIIPKGVIFSTVSVVVATGGTAYAVYRGGKFVLAIIITASSGGSLTPLGVFVAVSP